MIKKSIVGLNHNVTINKEVKPETYRGYKYPFFMPYQTMVPLTT